MSAKERVGTTRDLIALAVEAISAGVADRLGPALARQSAYVTQSTAPISKSSFLRHAAKGEFPAYMIGKQVVVRRMDFDAWLEKHPRIPRKAKPPRAVEAEKNTDAQADEDDDLRAMLGLKSKAKPADSKKKGRAA